MIERQPSRPPRHYAKRHRRPGDVHWPAVWHRELDYESHHQEHTRSQSGRQPENEEDGKENFAGTDKERRVVQLQETVPFVDAGSPEWSRESEAHDKLRERRLGDRRNNGVHPLKEPTDRLPSVAGDLLLRGHWVSL